jgi:hypothetical protein
MTLCRNAFVAALIAACAALATPALGQEAAALKGRIVGERCAKAGKIGECYLKWAEPMVLYTEDGDQYAIDLGGRNRLTQERLDEAFGQEVEVHGWVIGGAKMQMSQLNILRPAAGKEFFKG